MKNMVCNCPACSNSMKIQSLICDECGLEIRTNLEIPKFSRLNEKQMSFLYSFLKNQGKLNAVQEEFGISYPTAKAMYAELLKALEIEENKNEKELLDMNLWKVNENSMLASDIIKSKLKACGGKAYIPTYDGTLRELVVGNDGTSFFFERIATPFDFVIFDIVVDLLSQNNGRAKKGNSRNSRLGEAGCEADTVAGCIGYHYYKKQDGDSFLDPVHMVAAILSWAEIAHNKHGFIELTPTYKEWIRK